MPLSAVTRSLEELERDVVSGADQLAFIPYAEALRTRGRLAQSLRVCQSGLSRWPSSVAGRVLLARIHCDMGKYNLAEHECHRVLTQAPESVSVRKLLALMALKNRHFVRALTYLEDLTSETPEDPEVASMLHEVQRRLAEKFQHELTLSGAFTVRESSAQTRDLILARIRERPEVRRCELITPGNGSETWRELLRDWQAACVRGGVSAPRLTLLETLDRTVLIHAPAAETPTLVVTLAPGAAFGPVKHLAEKFASLGADEVLTPGSESPSPGRESL